MPVSENQADRNLFEDAILRHDEAAQYGDVDPEVLESLRHANGFCSMGFALPGAIAAKLVHPDRRVLAVCGDGGFLMSETTTHSTSQRTKSLPR